jgi:intergrase/recombinase
LHYLAKMKQADDFYSKIADRLPTLADESIKLMAGNVRLFSRE